VSSLAVVLTILRTSTSILTAGSVERKSLVCLASREAFILPDSGILIRTKNCRTLCRCVHFLWERR
jgi:hypothetical protein